VTELVVPEELRERHSAGLTRALDAYPFGPGLPLRAADAPQEIPGWLARHLPDPGPGAGQGTVEGTDADGASLSHS
jgi:hypothetical protein